MTFSELVRSLATNVGLALNDDVASPVEIRVDELSITLTEEQHGADFDLVLSVILGKVPEAQELEAYRVMLEANVFWAGTAGCVLGVNAQTREAVICYRVAAAGLTGDSLADILDFFAYVSGNWANFVESLDASAASSASASLHDIIYHA